MGLSHALLVFAVVAPGVMFGVFGLLWLVGKVPTERVLSRVTGTTFSACVAALAAIVWMLARSGSRWW